MRKESRTWYLVQRGALLAQEFLLELGARYVASLEDVDVGLDFLAFFPKDDETDKIIAIEVKATEQELNGRYTMPASHLVRLQTMNVPTLIIVTDVKRNEIYFSWAHEAVPSERLSSLRNSHSCTIRLRKSTVEEREKLRQEILSH